MALDLGCGRGHIAKHMNSDIVGTLYQCDVAEHMVVSDSYQEQIRDTCNHINSLLSQHFFTCKQLTKTLGSKRPAVD